MCNASHSDKSCWYNDPRQAPAHWAPSESAPYKAIQLYQRRCAELGVVPKAPGARSAPSTLQQGGRAPPRAQAAAAAFADPNGQPDLHAAALMPEAADDTESLGGWFMAGSCMRTQDDCSSSSSYSAGTTFAAALGGRDKQPLSFLPPASVQPRSRAAATGTAADTPAATAITAGDVQMQITFAGSPTKLWGLLQQMSEAGLLETTTADTASAGACAAAAAAPDSGCEPNIMTRAQADACQLYYRPLKEGELNIMTIEGNATSCFIGRTDPDPPACSGTGQGIKEEESTTDQGSGTASSAQPVLHFCSSAPAEDVPCSMPTPQKATFEYVDNSSCIKHAAAPEAPYHKHGTLHYRLGSIHHSARNVCV
ncbi:hypothetical protein OEZ85_006053 [Tetradesmus obliquus]|uniref:Uncharacterized protein n=1 Tax=Tetradesmus obliquus TaxID=3088 RepID=A0ABY8UGC2_TETOB|nr:hypothetical protein OEZ85_006053 [Tetradesmus obliquus]